jgi:ABC-type multidrug transport system ATPase subunit
MMLECRDINFTYPGAENPLFSHLSFNIESPGFHALFGPSGVGKTSFAKLLTQSLNTFSGDIRTRHIDTLLYAYNLERLPGWSSISRHLEKIVPSSLTNRMNVLIDTFGLAECMHLRFSRLSLGQQNRINLIRYLLQDFQLLIMDESLANVDEPTREKIILKIKDIFPDRVFLYISHNVVEVATFCRDILVFRNAHKNPQVLTIPGQDLQFGKTVDRQKLGLTMLEIMNAS